MVADIKSVFQSITKSVCHLGLCSKAYNQVAEEAFDYIGKIKYLWQPGKDLQRLYRLKKSMTTNAERNLWSTLARYEVNFI